MAEPNDQQNLWQIFFAALTGGGFLKALEFLLQVRKTRREERAAALKAQREDREQNQAEQNRAEELKRELEETLWQRTRSEFARITEKADRLEQRTQALEAKVEELEAALEVAQSDLARTERELAAAQSEVSRLTMISAEQAGRILELQEERNALKAICEELERELIFERSGGKPQE